MPMQSQAKVGHRLPRAAAAEALWQLALSDERSRDELSKSSYVDVAVRLLDSGLPEEQHVVAGLLACMASDAVHSNLDALHKSTTEHRTVVALSRILATPAGHPRSKARSHPRILLSPSHRVLASCTGDLRCMAKEHPVVRARGPLKMRWHVHCTCTQSAHCTGVVGPCTLHTHCSGLQNAAAPAWQVV
jgi:hypothetical protein